MRLARAGPLRVDGETLLRGPAGCSAFASMSSPRLGVSSAPGPRRDEAIEEAKFGASRRNPGNSAKKEWRKMSTKVVIF